MGYLVAQARNEVKNSENYRSILPPTHTQQRRRIPVVVVSEIGIDACNTHKNEYKHFVESRC
jgi:hypothetical protein